MYKFASGPLQSQPGLNPPADSCVPNIGPRERAARMRFGIFGLALGMILAAVLIGLGLAREWRLVLFFVFAGGATGIFQALDKT